MGPRPHRRRVYFEKQVVRDNLELQIVSRRKVQREDVSRRFSEDGIVLYEFKHQRPLQHSGEITTYPGVENGTYREFHPDGSLAVHLLLQNGKAYGRGATYYPTGKKESEFQFQENEVQGAANLYYADGRIRLNGAFEEGSPEGLTQLYHENGKVWTELIYDAGELNGPVLVYDSEGTQIAEHVYQDGLLTKEHFIWEGGMRWSQLDTMPSSDQLLANIKSQKKMLDGLKSAEKQRQTLIKRLSPQLTELESLLRELEAA